MSEGPGQRHVMKNWCRSKLLLEETGWKVTNGVEWKEGRVEEHNDKTRQKHVCVLVCVCVCV